MNGPSLRSDGPVDAAGAAGPVDAQTDARPQGPWTPANGRRRPQPLGNRPTAAGFHSAHKAALPEEISTRPDKSQNEAT